ncbi:hypothetical protein ACIA8C_31270 [Nocardia sp. NPDC051321]|uniref:hypothetical protein n=1 Tax=Nocardia sp. NPDC051321 TaxID=3364323 RepID=UPI0037AB1C4B
MPIAVPAISGGTDQLWTVRSAFLLDRVPCSNRRRRRAGLGTPDRLPVVAALYLEVAALSDDEVLAQV